MKNLTEIRVNGNHLSLDGNMVKGGILPEKIAELARTVTIQKDTVVDGPIYANKITVESGEAEVTGAVFAQHEIYVNTSATGKIIFRKAVASAKGVASRANDAEVTFCSDINAKEVALTNAFVAGSIYADDVVLDNCVIVGGVFATNTIEIKDTIVGTFNAPSVTADGTVQLFLPTAFSQEPMITTPNTRFYNLSLADLGGLFKGNPQAADSGKIPMNIAADDIKTTLSDENSRKTLHTYTVVGKVLPADMVNADKFQNHFLLTAAALGPQLLRSYDLGPGEKGNISQLTPENIRAFFFKVLRGQIEVQNLSGTFSMGELLRD